ncbi:MAG: transporter substrate-binding domain-containing protein, partial [Planctomycetaceae bacterium]|nr:transporter substrate-binding domain-containing protein [Planctomycetaceae bacterium]
MFTDAIAERSAKYFRIAASQPRWEILKSRPLRLAFLEDSSTANSAIAKLKETSVPHEVFYFSEYADAYKMLVSDEVDAVVDEEVSESAFDEFGSVVAEDFFPLIYEPVALSTQNPELAPIIGIFQKALQNGGRNYLADIYEQGTKEYSRHKLFLKFNEQELKYIQEHKAVNYLAEHDNYPLSFYNHNEKQWQGIAFDVLSEITSLTGLTFEPINKPGESFADLMKKLENGEGAMLSELIRTDQRKGRFIWPENDLLQDNYVAISLEEALNISIHRIALLKVGVQKGTAYAELFSTWFPAHKNVIEYDGTEAAFQGLEGGEIDILMYSVRNLLTATNYNERPGFKANIVFEYTFRSTFGLNKDEEILCSIVDKAMSRMDYNAI